MSFAIWRTCKSEHTWENLDELEEEKNSIACVPNVYFQLERDVLQAVRHPFIVDMVYAFQAANKVSQGYMFYILTLPRGGATWKYELGG